MRQDYPDIYGQGDGESLNVGEVKHLGLTEQELFMEEYGPYMEMVYLVCNGDLLKMNDVLKMKAHEFLFAAQYLIRKRKVDNKANQRR